MERRLEKEKAARILNAMPCPDDCPNGGGGVFQTYDMPEGLRIACLKCGDRIDLETVKIVFETKER